MNKTGYTVLEKSGSIATITLNRPEQSNALSPAMRASLQTSLDDAATDKTIDVVVIQGAGKVFCGGLDANTLPNDPFEWRERVQAAQQNHLAIIRMPKVVIAAVHGAVIGGGASLALAADILIMSDDAYLSFPFLHLGIVPDGGSSYFLQSKLGTPMALDLLLTGGKIRADEAQARGLTRRVVPAQELGEAAQALAGQLCQVTPESRMLTKSLCQQHWAANLEAALRHEADAFALATASQGHQTALERLRQRRKSD